MARAPLPLGSWGLIRTYPGPRGEDGKPRHWRAVADYRDFDGHVRRVQANGRSATAASQALRRRLQHRSQEGRNGELTGLTRFREAAGMWQDKLDAMVGDGRRSPATVDTYRRQLRNHVLPALGEVRLAEVTTPLVDRVITAIRSSVGPATAKSCRSVISGVLSLAVRYGAIAHNPVREADRIEAMPRRAPRALSTAERVDLFRALLDDPRSREHDLPDLVFFMLATGVRIGEALATTWSQVDLEAGTVQITSTLVRLKGEGLLRKSTKTSAGERTLALPMSAVAVLRRRFMTGARLDQPLFPDTRGGFRDPANTRRELREARRLAGMEWVTSHTFRKTAATMLDEAALSARLVADQLGHSRPSMTQDVYLARRAVGSQAALALEAGLRGSWPEDEKRGKTVAHDEGQDE